MSDLSSKKFKEVWSKNDVIIALYYEKFGLRKLGVLDEDRVDDFVMSNIGSTESSIKMTASNLRYIMSGGNCDDGLSHFSKTQVDVVNEYNGLDEEEFRIVIECVLDDISDEQRNENIKNVEDIRTYNEEIKKSVVYEAAKADMKERFKLSAPKNVYGNGMKSLSTVKSDDVIPVGVGGVLEHKNTVKVK